MKDKEYECIEGVIGDLLFPPIELQDYFFPKSGASEQIYFCFSVIVLKEYMFMYHHVSPIVN